MYNGEINFAHADHERIVAHRWIDRFFMFVPGSEKYNLRLNPGVSPDWQFDCDHGRFGIIDALKHLVQRHGGPENLFTADMKSEAERCLRASRSIEAAVELVERRYQVMSKLGQLAFSPRHRHFQYGTRCGPDHLESVIGAPDVQILAKLYGPRLGRELMGRVVERNQSRRRGMARDYQEWLQKVRREMQDLM